jgi:hypothetical protein
MRVSPILCVMGLYLSYKDSDYSGYAGYLK